MIVLIIIKIRHSDDSTLLQNDTELIAGWCEEWQMKIDINYSKYIRFNPTQSIIWFQYKPHSFYFFKVSSYKYLGVNFSEDLSWIKHINNIVSNASKFLRYLKRNFHLVLPPVKLIA